MEKTPDQVDIHVGARVAARRAEMGLPQSTIASALGISWQQVAKYESAANRISCSKLYRIAVALDVPIDYFFAGLDGLKAADAGGDDAHARRLRYILAPDGAALVDAAMSINRKWRDDLTTVMSGLAKMGLG